MGGSRGAGESAIPHNDSQVGYTLHSVEPVFVEDLAGDERFSGPPLLTRHGVVSAMSVVIPDQDHTYGVLGVYTSRHRSFSADDGDFLRSLANIIGGAVQSDAAREQNGLRLRYETALAECAKNLLASRGENRLEQAVEALLSATQATYVAMGGDLTYRHQNGESVFELSIPRSSYGPGTREVESDR